MIKKKAIILKELCVGCGCCLNTCPKNAISIKNGVYALVDNSKCVGCGLCKKACPASIIEMGGVS